MTSENERVMIINNADTGPSYEQQKLITDILPLNISQETASCGSDVREAFKENEDIDKSENTKVDSSDGKSQQGGKKVTQCKVCGDDASGMYFGAIVCVPCKTFFLRYAGEGFSFVCKMDKRCEITVQTRTQCKYCRYQKCLQVGMFRKVRPAQVQIGEGQQLCVVCHDVANGIHFGASTCEGCKKFFRRGLMEHASYTCKANSNCVINPRTRNSCRYCRYQACLKAGMSREAIQMGRPSKLVPVSCSTSAQQDAIRKTAVHQHSPDDKVALPITYPLQQRFEATPMFARQSSLSSNMESSSTHQSFDFDDEFFASKKSRPDILSRRFSDTNRRNSTSSTNSNSDDSLTLVLADQPGFRSRKRRSTASSIHSKTSSDSKEDPELVSYTTTVAQGKDARSMSFISAKVEEIDIFEPSTTTFNSPLSNIPLQLVSFSGFGQSSNTHLLDQKMKTENLFIPFQSGYQGTELSLSAIDYRSGSKSVKDESKITFSSTSPVSQNSNRDSLLASSSQRTQGLARRFQIGANSAFHSSTHVTEVPLVGSNSSSPESRDRHDQVSSTQTALSYQDDANSDDWRSNCPPHPDRKGSGSQPMGDPLDIDIEQQERISEQYWMNPILPDVNIMIAGKHWEIIKQIVPAYDLFVNAGTTLNKQLKAEYQQWTSSCSEAELANLVPKWIQNRVIPQMTLAAITYFKSLPGFTNFDPTDQATLIRMGQSANRLLIAALHWYDPEHKTLKNFLSWRDLKSNQLDLFKQKLIEYCEKVQSLEMDPIESAILNALLIIATDFPDLVDPSKIDLARQQILGTFQAYITAKCGTPNNRLEVLSSYVPAVRKLGLIHHKMTYTANLRAEELGHN